MSRRDTIHAPGKLRVKEVPMSSRRVGFALAALLAGAAAGLAAQSQAEQGKVVYEKWCAQCHGETGEGNGPAAHYMYPRPRDFVAALYQVRSTASGALPTDDDIMHAID